MISCRVCRTGTAIHFLFVDDKQYWRCPVCEATFVDASHFVDSETERKRYMQHRNDPYDAAYRAFLSRLADPLLERLPPGQAGLDFGCGPGPALARMLTEAGYRMQLYDPFFYPDTSTLNHVYDFITCTEVAEHMHHPAEEFSLFDRLLRPGGWLAIMTLFQTEDKRFADWFYWRDPTHVTFYREGTFRYIAGEFGWECIVPRKDVVLMRKGL